MTEALTISQLTCLRCGRKWFPLRMTLPSHCPRCKSPYWNKPRNDVNKLPCPKCRSLKIAGCPGGSNLYPSEETKDIKYMCMDCLFEFGDYDVNKLGPIKYNVKCLRCGHTWSSVNIHPVRCAKCKSPYWDRVNKEAETPGVNKEE